jgi:four helix bundle protein
MGVRLRSFKDLDVYRLAFQLAMELFEVTKRFPREERYSLTDQIRRSSRSVCANLAEAFFKRNYPAAFVSKLSDSLSEAAETQVWLDFSRECNYIDAAGAHEKSDRYAHVIGKLITMMNHPEDWRI